MKDKKPVPKIKPDHRCTLCGSPHTVLEKVTPATSGAYLLFQCWDCDNLFQIWSVPK